MSPSPRAPRPAGAAIFRFEGSGHAPALRCARGLPLKSNGDPSATRPRMRNSSRCSRCYGPLTRREVMNDESRDESADLAHLLAEEAVDGGEQIVVGRDAHGLPRDARLGGSGLDPDEGGAAGAGGVAEP